MSERLTKRIDLGNGKYTIDFANEKVGEFLNDHKKGMRALFEKLAEYEDLEEQGLLLRLPCKVGDTIWELCKCDDNVYRIFPMVVKKVIPDGSVRWIKGKEPTVWNIYATSDYTDMYKTFYDIGKTVFLTQFEAEEKLRELEGKQNGKLQNNKYQS